MKRFIIFGLFLLAVFLVAPPHEVLAATGDVTVKIAPDGWSVYVTTAGFTSGATYNFGLTGNNVPTASTPFFTVVSLGYDTTGSPTTITRTVYLTHNVRYPFGTGFLTTTIGSGTFVDGETVTQTGTGATGTVVGNQLSGTKLVFYVTSGKFNNIGLLTGAGGALATSTGVFNYIGTYGATVNSGSWAGTITNGHTITQDTTGATGVANGTQTSGVTLSFVANSMTGSPSITDIWRDSTSPSTNHATASGPILVTAIPAFEEVSTSGLTARMSLSDYIYQKDNTGGGNSGTAPTVTVPAAFITNSGGAGQTSNALSGAAVTQSSTASYPVAVANWSYPGYQREPGDFPLRAVAYHNSAINGKPLACIIFTAADAHSHTATTTVSGMSIDATLGALDSVPVVEFVGTMATSTLSQGDILTCNFTAYPWVGDSASVLTSVGGTAPPSGLLGPQYNINDKSGTYGVAWALITTGGSDGSGQIVNRASYASDAAADAAAGAHPFASFGGASHAAYVYNNANFSRADIGGAHIRYDAGTYDLMSTGTTASGSSNNTYLVIESSSNTNAAGVIFNASSGPNNDFQFTYPFQFHNVTVSIGGAFFFARWLLDFNQCPLTETATAGFYQSNYYVTDCTVGHMEDGFNPYTVSDTSQPMLIRGNALTSSFSGPIYAYTVLGNSRPAGVSTGANILTHVDSQTIPEPDQPIIAYNNMRGSSASPMLSVAQKSGSTGAAVVQNIFENSNSGGSTVADTNSDNLNATPNLIFWHNVLVGQRWNMGYNATGTTNYARYYWSVKNNLIGDYNIKSDTYTQFTAGNGVRQGDWPTLYGTNMSGNVWGENIAGSGASGDFLSNFIGVNSIQPAVSGEPPSGTPNAAGYFVFANDLSWHTGPDTAGNGDYHASLTSPQVTLQHDWVLPYDLAGVARTALDATGAYHFGTNTGGVGYWWP